MSLTVGVRSVIKVSVFAVIDFTVGVRSAISVCVFAVMSLICGVRSSTRPCDFSTNGNTLPLISAISASTVFCAFSRPSATPTTAAACTSSAKAAKPINTSSSFEFPLLIESV